MPTKILINGSAGKMGQATAKALSKEANLMLICQADIQDSLAQDIQKSTPDIVIDFTSAEHVFEHLNIIIEHDVRPIIGTSGLTEAQIQEAKEMCAKKQLGGIIAPNFSIGAVLMMKYAADCARYFPDVEIIEEHHPGKKDAPSGTAIKTADMIVDNRLGKPHHESLETIEGALGANYKNVPIHSLRLPGTIANQSVVFGGPGQTLTIRHDTLDREAFMPGVILACREVMSLNELIYGLENLL